MNGDSAVYFILFITLGVLVVVFLISRELILWYWRVNEGLKVLKSIDSKLSHLVTKLHLESKEHNNKNSKEDREHIEYNENGDVSHTAYYDDGVREGKSIKYYDNGYVMWEEN